MRNGRLSLHPVEEVVLPHAVSGIWHPGGGQLDDPWSRRPRYGRRFGDHFLQGDSPPPLLLERRNIPLLLKVVFMVGPWRCTPRLCFVVKRQPWMILCHERMYSFCYHDHYTNCVGLLPISFNYALTLFAIEPLYIVPAALKWISWSEVKERNIAKYVLS